MRSFVMAAAAAGFVASAASAEIVTVDLTNVNSWDGLGDADNDVLSLDLAAAIGLPSGSEVVVDAIGWDVTIETIGGSWLSEARIAYDDSGDGTPEIFLTPGFGDDFAGSDAYSSGGLLVLADAAIPDLVLADGVLTLEFYEGFDDVADEIDAIWGGELALNVVPAPGALALLGLAGAAGTRRRRA